MNLTLLAEQIRIEADILSHSRQALVIALDAPIELETCVSWVERSRFLTQSFERHVSRLFRVKNKVDGERLALEAKRPGMIDQIDQIETEQETMVGELRMLANEARALDADNLANLHAFQQRLVGFIERFDEAHERECKIWLEAWDTEIGGEG